MRTFIVMASAVAAEELEIRKGSPLEALQSQLAMVEQSVKAAGKVTPGVYKVVNQMKDMITTVIEPAIRDAHNADMLLVKTTHAEIGGCDSTYKADKVELSKAEAALNKLDQDFAKVSSSVSKRTSQYVGCVPTRDALVKQKDIVCCEKHDMCPNSGPCEIVKLNQAYVGCNYKDRTADECYAHAEKLVASLEGYFTSADAKYEGLRAQCTKYQSSSSSKTKECAILHDALETAVAEHNKVVSDHNKAGRDLMKSQRAKCSTYKSCRERTTSALNKVYGPCKSHSVRAADTKKNGKGGSGCVDTRCADRKNEWKSTQLIKCMLQHYCKGGHFDAALLSKCKKSIGTYHLECKKPGVPSVMPCVIKTYKDEGTTRAVKETVPKHRTCNPAAVKTGCTSVEQPECPGWCK